MEQKRILLVDDNEAIHRDFRKALELNKKEPVVDELHSKIFAPATEASVAAAAFPAFLVDSAYQGLEAVELVRDNFLKNNAMLLHLLICSCLWVSMAWPLLKNYGKSIPTSKW